MSNIADVIARMATDPGFAARFRLNPQVMADPYGLTAAEIDQVLALTISSDDSGATALGARVSKSSIGLGVVGSLLHLAAPSHPLAGVSGFRD